MYLPKRRDTLPSSGRERVQKVAREQDAGDIIYGCIVALVILALAAFVGSVDYQSEQAAQQNWREQNGVVAND